MATEKELYEILLKVASEVDPKVFKDLQSIVKGYEQFKISVDEINRDLASIAQRKYPEVFRQYQEELRAMTDEGEQAHGMLGGLLADLKDVAKIAAGILVRDVIVGSIRLVGDLVSELKNMAVGFVAGVKDVNEQMNFYQAQLVALLGGVQEAAQAVDYVRRMAIVTPLYGVAELTDAIRLITAFGLNYERWMPVIAGTAAATGSSLQQIANAFGMIASGATTRGLYYLKIAGINVREAGIEFDKSGKAIGTTQEILEALESYLTTRYGALMPEIAKTWRGSVEAMRDMWYQFRWQLGLPAFEIVREKLASFQNWLTENQDNILAFASVLGEYPARALQSFLDFIGEVTGQIDFQAQDFFQGAVNLMVSFADGLLTALDSYVLPAVIGIADLIASFLLGSSPPPEGPLSRAYEGAVAVMRTYLLGLKEGVDFQTINEIAGFIQSALTHIWTMQELPEEQLYPMITRARLLVARAINEMRTMGAITPEVTGELAGLLGPLYQDVSRYLSLLRELQIATDAVTAAQDRLRAAQERLAAAQAWVEEATKRVQAAQDALRRFDIMTAEIPERFTRGRRRELELALQEAEEERRRRQESIKAAQEQVRAAQEQVKAAQEHQRAIQDQISLQRALFSEMERMWKLEEQRKKAEEAAAEEGQQTWTDTKVKLKEVETELDKLKEKWRGIFAEVLEPSLDRLSGHWSNLADMVRGFLGIVPTEPVGIGWVPGVTQLSEAYKEGERLREALDTIRGNLDNIPDRIREIMEEVKKWAIIAGGIYIVLKGFKIAEGLVWTAALAKTLGIGAAGVIASASGILIPVTLALTITGLALSGALPEPVRNLLYVLFPNLEVAAKTLGTDTGNTVIQSIIERITGQAPDTEKAADEGFLQPILNKARELWDELVGRSIFPDMIQEIIDLFRRLPWRLAPYLVTLYSTVTLWATTIADSWIRQFDRIEDAAETLITVLQTLLTLLERINRILGGISHGTTIGGWTRHAGGPILRTGQYRLEAGEYVLNREQTALAGVGAMAGLVGATINFIHNWPKGIDELKRPQIQRIAEDAAYKAVDRLMIGSGRD